MAEKTLAMVDGKKTTLEDYLLQCIQEAVDRAAYKAVGYLTDYIEKNWYSKYNPKRYERTRDFINSTSKTETTLSGRSGNEVVCMIFFDTSKIIPRYYGPGFLNPHANTWGQSTAEQIPKWIERGGWFYGRGKTDGLGSMEATIKWLENNFSNMVKKELSNMGLKVKVVS